MHFNQNKAINTLVSALRSQQVQVELLKDSINITYSILDNIFQILDSENVLVVMQIIPCLAILSKKSESDIAIIVKNFMKKMIC